MEAEYAQLYEKLKEVVELDVYKGRVRIGTLVRMPNEKGGTTVSFNPALDANNNPVDPGVYNKASFGSRPNNLLPPYFAHLLPEGKRLERIKKLLGMPLKENDQFSILAALGADAIGDICVTKNVNGSRAQVQISNALDDSPTIEFDGSRSLEELLEQELHFQQGVAVAGAQPKVSVFTGTTHIHIHSPGTDTTEKDTFFIVKTPNPHFPEMIANERFFMDLAAQCGFNVPKIMTVDLADSSQVLLIERFDRIHNPENERRIEKVHVEDGAQLLALDTRILKNGLYVDAKYQVSWEKLSKAVLETVDPSVQAETAETLFKTYFYSYMIGNSDLHAKNISVWDNPQTGKIELSPSYDFVSTIFYQGKNQMQDKNMALFLGGRKDGISRARFLEYAENIGIEKTKAESIMGEIARAVEARFKDFDTSALNPNKVNFALGALKERHQAFMHLGLNPNSPTLN